MREKVAESLIVAENFLDLSNEMNIQIREACVCMLSHFSHVRLFATLWTIARHYPLSIVPCRQEYWSGLQCSPPRIFLTQGSNPHLWHLLHWEVGFFLPLAPLGKPSRNPMLLLLSRFSRPQRWQPTRLPCPWDSPGKNTEVGPISFSNS